MRINMYDAGLSVSQRLGDGVGYPTTNVEGGVHYAAHLLGRHVVVPFIYDAGMQKYASFIAEQNSTVLVENDTIATHWLYAGTKITDIVAHIKQPVAGLSLVAQVRKVSDNTAVGAAFTIDASKAGYTNTGKTLPIAAEDVYLDVAIKGGNLHTACFSLFVELTYFNDQHKCSCAKIPCKVEFPNPMECGAATPAAPVAVTP